MKKVLIAFILIGLSTIVFAQQYEVPAGAILLESTIMKDDGKPYLIEALYKLKDGSQMSVYYDAEGSNEVIIQKVLAAKTPAEQQRVLATQRPVFNISSANMQSVYQNMPGYIRYKFNDRYEMSQFLRIMKLVIDTGTGLFGGKGNSPNWVQQVYDREGKPAYLMYDKYDGSWSCETSSGFSHTIVRVR